MAEGITLTRNGYGNWFIKDTELNDTPERSVAWIKSLKCDRDDAD